MFGILLGIAGVVIGTGVSKVTREENERREVDIRYKVREMERTIENTKSLAENTEQKCNAAIKTLNNRKKKIYNTTFKIFTENADKIANIDFNNYVGQATKIKEIDTNNIKPSMKEPKSLLTSGVGSMLMVSAPTFSMFSQINYSLKLDEIEAETEEAYAELKANVALVKRECTKIKSITKLAKTTLETCKTLQVLADNATAEMIRILDDSGNDFSKYSESEKEHIFITFKLIDTLNKLLNLDIVTKSGNVNRKLQVFIGEVNEGLEE